MRFAGVPGLTPSSLRIPRRSSTGAIMALGPITTDPLSTRLRSCSASTGFAGPGFSGAAGVSLAGRSADGVLHRDSHGFRLLPYFAPSRLGVTVLLSPLGRHPHQCRKDAKKAGSLATFKAGERSSRRSIL